VSSHARAKSAFKQVRPGRCLSQNLYRPKPQRFNVELSDLDLAEEDPVEVLDDQLKAKFSKPKTSLVKTLPLCRRISPLLFPLRVKEPLG
jgi:hypothetical protein